MAEVWRNSALISPRSVRHGLRSTYNNTQLCSKDTLGSGIDMFADSAPARAYWKYVLKGDRPSSLCASFRVVSCVLFSNRRKVRRGGGKRLDSAEVRVYANPCAAMLPLQEGGEVRAWDRLIQDGDLVIVYESYKQLKAVTVMKDGELQNRYGVFMHNDWIGKPFGCKVTGKKGGFVHLLAPSPQLWTLALTHRTQILYIMDISFVLAYLEVRPGCVVMESGTGSGSLTTALARAVAPTGHVYSFDFHEQRAEAARKDFERTGLSGFVTVTVRDIQGEGFPQEFANEVDAVFLDLPQPWLAIPSVAKSLRADSPMCSFSPCMEQVQRTCEALATTEFRDLRTFEVLLRTYEAHEEYFGTDLGLDLISNEVEGSVLLSPNGSPPHKRLCSADSKISDEKDQTEVLAMKEGSKKGRGRGEQPQGSRRVIVARPEAEAKGHTGYLTFARKAV